jgi:hypothetical protein
MMRMGLQVLGPDVNESFYKEIHATMIQDGLYHLHQFSIPDAGVFEKGAVIYPLHFII